MTEQHVSGSLIIDGEVVCIRYSDRPRIRDIQDADAEAADADGPECGA